MDRKTEENEETLQASGMESDHALSTSADDVIREWLFRFRTGWKWSVPLVLVLLVVAFMLGLWEALGSVLTLFGIVWYVIRFRERRKSRGSKDLEVRFDSQHRQSLFYPVMTILSGGFLILGVDTETGAFAGWGVLLENIGVLFVLGSLILLVSERILQGNWKRYRIPAIVSVVVFVVILELV
ncbi:hypothetical protein [Salisediminibacterium selenitireducens]|uniref:Uncharacterized protein n=1 Tax=Bacillus selenitireducens (strain ATCC 700615 / DSM 15326 / MLS10) TaxID=439292 RepID=D6Y0G8_BACIE|nr:hypothetical protein [Salisediminibacterium selenitireducens]ADH98559.1 hypothetical protein Bsel_1040 [[Bacillus] selenitireducens MLS10]